ncbi:MAG: TolC family protein [Candidatus Latescibacterota bacterium]
MIQNIVLAAVFVLTLAGGYAWSSPADPRDRSLDSLGTAFNSSQGSADFNASAATLDDYLSYAAAQSPALRAAFYRWSVLVEKSAYAGVMPNPVISYMYFVENVETRVGPQEQRVSFRQAFPWFGTLGTKKDIASQEANATYQKFQSDKFKLFYEVKSAYYEYYFLGRDLAITRENLELLKFWESIARAKYRVALKKHPDVIKAQVELGKLEDRVRTLEEMAGPVSARLRAAVNLPDSVQLPLPGTIDIDETEWDRTRVIQEVMIHNPDLASLRHVIDKEEAGMRLAGKMSRPGFVIGLDYIQTGEAVNPAMLDSGKDPWMVSVGVSVPIWFGANKARKMEAAAKRREAEYRYADAQNRLKAFAEQVMFDTGDALRKTRLYRDGLVPKAEQSLNASYTAYQAGETDFLNVLDAQRQLLDFQLQFERSTANLAIGRAKLEMLMGRQFDR